MARPARIGMIVPSSNTCLEPQTYRILGDRRDVTVHFTRIAVARIALDDDANTQFDPATMVAAANLLRAAEMDVIAWNGTAGSWLGVEHDRTMVDRITEATGIPATTTTLAYREAFDKFGISSVGLISPYTADVNAAIVQQYARTGIAVAGERHLGLSINESFARVDPQVLLQVSLELAGALDQRDAAAPDALVYLCTNLYGASIVEDVETLTGLPALDSVAVTLWRCLAMAGAGGLEKRWGRLLT
jgi:maleate isomerase